MSGRIEFKLGFSTTDTPSRPRETDAMKILILGDFSASSGSDKDTRISARRLYPLDVDTLDTRLGHFAFTLNLELENGLKAAMTFSTMDDFHPDSLYRRLSVFDELRDIAQRLSNNQTFPEAAAQLRSIHRLEFAENNAGETAGGATVPASEDDGSTFERLLGRPATAETQPGQRAHSTVEKLIGEAIKDQIVPEASPAQSVYTAAVEDAISQLMRQILQHPQFKRAEALWRGLEFLVRRIEQDEFLQVSILDVSREELFMDFQQAGGNLEQSELYQRLVAQGVQTAGNSPWSLIMGAYTFDASSDDVATLAALGAVAAQAGGPFLAAGSPMILGCPSRSELPNPRDWNPEAQGSENWNALRQSQIAPWIGLALPRILLRLPYGQNTDEIEAFAFEEVTKPRNSAELLWGNPAFACVQLIAQAFTEQGWQMQPDSILEVGNLPAYSYQDDGEWAMTPCAEALLPEPAIDKIMINGLIPLVSLKNTNSIRMPRFQSISASGILLRGLWHTASRHQ